MQMYLWKVVVWHPIDNQPLEWKRFSNLFILRRYFIGKMFVFEFNLCIICTSTLINKPYDQTLKAFWWLHDTTGL